MCSRFILVAIVSLLFCSLSTLETPELVKLADDTSNDYSLLTHQEEVSASIRDLVPIARANPSRRRSTIARKPIQLRFSMPSRPAQDFLHFLCVQRT